jgi:hypothetical protein
MTTVVFELFEALKKAGVDEETARKAAQAVVGIEDKQQLATRLDVETLRREMAEIKADLIKWNVGTLIAMTGLFTAIVKLL